MKKGMITVLAAMILCVWCTVSVRAQSLTDIYDEQLEASGAADLYEKLPSETKELLERLGWDSLSVDVSETWSPQTVFSTLTDILSGKLSAPLASTAAVLGLMLFLGFCSTLQPPGSEHHITFRAVGMLTVAIPLLLPLWHSFERTAAAVDSACVFSLSFAPVYAAILSAQGSAMTAVSYQTVMLAAAEGISMMIGTVILPLTACALALGTGGALHEQSKLSDVGTLLNRLAVWLIGAALTIFVGMLSLQSVLAASADSVGGRVLRFSVAGFVPIVGGHLAEALYTVRGCLSALKGSIGGFGILSTVLIVLPTMFECIAWHWLLGLSKTVSTLFSLSEATAVVDAAQKAVKALIAILASLALLMIISVTVVTIAGGGTI